MVAIATSLLLMTTYYIDPTGDDRAKGTDPAHPLRSLSRLTEIGLKDGDRVRLKGGATFTAGFVVDKAVDFGSYGEGRAALTVQEGAVLTLKSGGVHIHDLTFQAEATTALKDHVGIKLLADAPGQRFKDVVLQDLTVRGFGGDGIVVGSTDPTRPGFDHLRIRRVELGGNHGAGLTTWDDAGDRTAGYAHHDLTIEDCRAIGNRGGTGFVVAGVDQGLVSRCTVRDTHGEGGGVGLWSWMSRQLIIRHCIVSGTRSGGGDGGGFDLDGGCVDCVVEDCLSFDNDGPGFMHCDYPGSPPTARNVCRRTVSLNDGRKKTGEVAGFGFVTWGSGLDDCLIEGCFASLEPDSVASEPQGILFSSYILGSQKPEDTPHIRGCEFHNCEVQLLGRWHAFISSTLPDPKPQDVRFVDNTFRCLITSEPVVRYGDTGKARHSFEQWQSNSNQPEQKLVLGTRPLTPYHDLTPDQLPQWLTNTLSRSLS